MSIMSSRNLTMMTDLYQLTMMYGYFKKGMAGNKAVFDLFFRDTKANSSYAVMAGTESIVEYINDLHFSENDVAYLRSLNLFDESFLSVLRGLHFTGEIYAMEEGTLVYPYEPLVRVIAPIMEAQLVETALLNLVNHQTLIATKASRVCYAAKGDAVMEFGLRRAQGPDAGNYGARAAVVGGCCGTSNVLTGQLFNIPILGTHAHSWVMSFPTELDAFRAYADIFPGNCLLLVDTYDTLRSGVPNAITVFNELRSRGYEPAGIRLDSGDLAYLTKKARKMLDEAGFPDAVICASSDLDEYLIESLKAQGAAIGSWGVGTNLITSKDHPAFGGVYKLAAIKDGDTFIPRIKLSENQWKITNPGNKTIYRVYDKTSGKIHADLICLADESFDENEPLLLFDPVNTWKKLILEPGTYTMREMLVPIFKGGTCVYNSPDVMDIRKYCAKEQDTLWDETKRFVNPHNVYVDLSEKLWNIKNELLASYSSSSAHRRDINA